MNPRPQVTHRSQPQRHRAQSRAPRLPDGPGTPRGLRTLAGLGMLAVLLLLAGSPANGAPPAPAPLEARAPAQPAPARGYDWPVAGDPPQVLRDFDPPPQPWLPGHRGVDLAAGAGAPVRAAGPGTVAFAGEVAGRPVVSVQHTDGVRTTYEPVTPQVQAGDAVEQGTVLGHLAETSSHCTQPCLHWGARTGAETYLDPLLLVGAEVVVRLYPPAPGPDG